jgi:hypothetical protein
MDDSTLTTASLLEQQRAAERDRWWRQAGVALLALLVGTALSGWLGVRSTSATARRDGYEVQFDYAGVARPGLAVPWRLTIRHPGGFASSISVTIDARGLAMIDQHAVDPTPDATTSDGRSVTWTFEPPAGDELTVSVDGQVEPGVHFRRTTTLDVAVDDVRLQLRATTWVLP